MFWNVLIRGAPGLCSSPCYYSNKTLNGHIWRETCMGLEKADDLPSTSANCYCLTLTMRRQWKKRLSGKLHHHGAFLCPGKMEVWATHTPRPGQGALSYTPCGRLGEEYLPSRLNPRIYSKGHEIYQTHCLVKWNSREDEFGFRKAMWSSQWLLFCTAAQDHYHQILLPFNVVDARINTYVLCLF